MTKTFRLNTGAEIPWLGFGTGTALYGRDAENSVRQAIENNIVHLDGAQMYNNEETLGAGIKASGKPRSELFITTKLDGKRYLPEFTVRETLVNSLAKLGVDSVDLFLIHDPRPATKEGKLADWWKQMEEVYKEGLTKAIGISNFTVDDLKIVLESGTIIPAVHQLELHPYVWKQAKPVVDLCYEKGIVIESYGGLTPLVRAPGGPLDPILAAIRRRVQGTRGKPVSSGQILTKWILAKNAVVVTTTSKVERIKEVFDVEDVPDLTPEEVSQIDEAGEKLYKRIYMIRTFHDDA